MLFRILLLVLITSPFSGVFAHDSTITWTEWKSSWDKKIIRTSRITGERKQNLIKAVEILDVRSDTERISLYKNEFHHVCELVYDAPISSVFNKNLCTNSGNETVLLVLRNFWISKSSRSAEKPEGAKSLISPRSQVSKLLCSIDAFIKKDDKYVPIAQLDTVFEDEKTVFYAAAGLTDKALSMLYSKIQDAVLARRFETKKLSDKEYIANVYNRRFEIAAFRNNNLKKGVYYTWEQFKNNQPVEKDFVMKANNNEAPTVYLLENGGEEIPARNIFAVADGSKVYKIQNGFGFPIYKNNNGIYWNGFEKYDTKTRGVPIGVGLGGGWFAFGMESIKASVKVRLTPYLLNVETGKEYE